MSWKSYHGILFALLWILVIVNVTGTHGGPPPTFLGFEASHIPVKRERFDSDLQAVGTTLIASPDKFSDSGADVTVAWKNVDSPSSSDWIAVYCGRETGPSASDYLDWLYVPFASANGSVTFTGLINMRCNYYFRYYVTRLGEYVHLAESNEVQPMGGVQKPMHARISLTSSEAEMDITWTTMSDTQATQLVRYSIGCADESSGDWDYTAFNTTAASTYSAGSMCQKPATTTSQQLFRSVGYFHSVLLTNLSPNTLYCYEYGNDMDGWSERSQFRTQKAAAPDVPTAFVAYGDMGVGASPAATSTALRVASEIDKLDFVLHVGDVSYARGYGYIWEKFHWIIEPISRRVPYMVSMGNHEYDHTAGGEHDPSGAEGQGFHPAWGNYGADSGGECGVPMYHRFRSPQDGNGIFWYSFNYGNVHVIQISSEHDYTVGSGQYQWLEDNLKGVDRSLTPFVIMTTHRPMYNAEDYKSDYEVSLHMREELDPLLDIYDVDVVIAGHYHSYERTCSVYNAECFDNSTSSTHKGTVHITVGSAGASLDSVAWYDVPWHEYGSFEFGYLRVTTSRDSMILEYVHNSDGAVADSVLLKARY